MIRTWDGTSAAVFSLAVGYLGLVQALRYRRRQKQINIYRQNNDNDTLDPEVARTILSDISGFEFPLIYRISLEFALFRTYAIPSISKLLHDTSQFETVCGKRYDDTSLLIEEINNNPLDSERSVQALQRLNAIHNMYSNRISNDDMLYVLSVFVLEPKKWIDRFEWRTMTEQEHQSTFAHWKGIGGRMGIKDIPNTLLQFEAWSEAYEEKHMKYAPSNALVGNATIALFLSIGPAFMHGFGKQAAYCLMDARLRAAMGFPSQTASCLQLILEHMMKLRQVCLRYVCLPRIISNQRVPFSSGEARSLCPRYHLYETTYKNGYLTANLGTAPAGKLMKDECPKYSG